MNRIPKLGNEHKSSFICCEVVAMEADIQKE